MYPLSPTRSTEILDRLEFAENLIEQENSGAATETFHTNEWTPLVGHRMASAVERNALVPRTNGETSEEDDKPRFIMTDDRPIRPRTDSNDLGSLSDFADLIQPSRSFDVDAGSSTAAPARNSYNTTLPKNPRDKAHSPARRTGPSARTPGDYAGQSLVDDFVPSANVSIASRDTGISGHSTTPVIPQMSLQWQWTEKTDPEAQEQTLFEQRLCEDAYGVAVRKINQNGKSTLRYVKCVPIGDAYSVDGDDHASAARSVSSIVRGLSRRKRASTSATFEYDNNSRISLIDGPHQNPSKMALTWGRKRAAKLSLDRFVCVRKGKTTDRTKRNSQPSYRLLSLVTDDVNNPSLDIEAPTRLDRDKFARAFAKFLKVPLEEEDLLGNATVSVTTNSAQEGAYSATSSSRFPASTAPDTQATANRNAQGKFDPKVSSTTKVVMSAASQDVAEHLEIRFEEMPPAVEATATGTTVDKKADGKETPLLQVTENVVETAEPSPQVLLSFPASKSASKIHNTLDITAVKEREQAKKQQAEETGTIVSSLTGAGFDQEIVEELHNALTELRAELEASRAEAARAVKVAEQAIQSAENSSSRDWSSTVTHKAAEAAALAQKRSAEAMSKMRLAEERLAVEKKNAGFWRKQAEAAEEEAGVLQTRIAAAEVQRAAMKEELDVERHKQVAVVASLKGRIESTESNQRDNLKAALAKNRSLEVELEGLQRELQARSKSSSIQEAGLPSMQQLFKVESETKALSQQFQLLQKSAMDEIKKLPALAQGWAKQMSDALASSRQEIGRLRSRLAAENATRRKLLHEVQDQRGVVRVYCRPRPLQSNSEASIGFLSFPSQETLLLRRSNIPWCQESSPLSFEFDRIFDSDVQQAEVYTEVEELLLGVLDGYNICVMAYGQTGCGKTYSLLGSVATSFDDETGEALVRLGNHGLQLTSMRQLFAVSGHRRDRYEDSFSLTIVEVRDERLCDLVAGTEMGETRGQVDFDDNSSRRSREQRHANSDDGSSFSKPLADTSTSSKGKLSKLEIRTNHDGDTVVQGLVSVTVNSFDDVIRVWQESLAQRAIRLSEQGVNLEKYEATSSVIATLKVISTNVATGIASVGKIQFVDLAGADLEPYEADDGKQQSQAPDTLVAGIADGEQWKLVNKSLTTLSEVASARCQFMRSVPYRNSTLTHLLRDSLEHDTKVLMLLCVSSDVEDARETTCALRMASRMRRINIGKATKHTLSHS